MGTTLELWKMIASLRSGAARSQLGSAARGGTVKILSYRHTLRAICLGLLLTAAGAPLHAQPPEGAVESEEEAVETLVATPRAALTRFFELSRRGDYEGAAKLLDLPPDIAPERAPELAKRLRLAMDQLRWIDLNKVSAANNGATGDGLPASIDEVTRLPIDRSLQAPVRLVRRGGADGRWLFSKMTVERIDDFYTHLPNRILLDLTPEPLLRMGPKSMLFAQWIALPVFLCLITVAGIALSRLSRKAIRPIVRRTSGQWDDALLERIGSPLSIMFAVGAGYLLLPLLGLYAPAQSFASTALRAVFIANFFWGLARSVDVTEQLLARAQWGHSSPSTRATLVFASRFGKMIIAAFALIALFSEMGYPVTTLLAGLGVGGIAVALSAQKSLENLFGAFAIAVDQPFREGDFIRVDGMLGTVEMIGMRSTRIRTLDRTLVSIPNGKLSEMRIETFAARDRVRMSFSFGLTYNTTESQLRAIISEFEELLGQSKKIWPDGRSVRFRELGESALMIEAGCFFNTADFDEFTVIRQELLLGLMKIVEQNEASFAMPTRTLTFDPKTASSAAPPVISGHRWENPSEQRTAERR
jgi:MscS family membrane protein